MISRKLYAVLFVLTLSLPSYAFDVTNSNPDGNGSLSWAVQQANQSPGSAININVHEITLRRELTLTSDVTINGNGAIIQGTYDRRLFRITSGHAAFNGITFMKGAAFSGNGGAVEIANDDASASFSNCTFYDNRAENYGGAVGVTRGSASSPVVFRHCTIAGNLARTGGGLAVLEGDMQLFSSIVLGNTGSTDIYGTSSRYFRSRYNVTGSSNLEMDESDITGQAMSEVIMSEPEAVNDALVFKLTGTSPARDIVPFNANYTLSADQTGTARPQLSAYDAGAYEALPVPIESAAINGSLYLQINDSKTFSVDITPSDASLDGIDWASSNQSVLTVDEMGTVHAVNIGSSSITARLHGWNSDGTKADFSPRAFTVYVDEEPASSLRASFADIPDQDMSPNTYKTITPQVTLSIGSTTLPNARGGVNYILEPSSTRLDIVTVREISGDSLILMAGDTPGSADIELVVRPMPEGEAMRGAFTVTVTQGGGAGRSSGGGGCESFSSGLVIMSFVLIFAERRMKR